MDIVSRIKEFISQKGLAVSQFADCCEIPRPTVSQLLNGRNKKVSDEIISKIHKAYPSLSINWLLFEEGNMFVDDLKQDEVLNQSENLDLTDSPSGGLKKSNLRGLNSDDSFDIDELTISESDVKVDLASRNIPAGLNLQKILKESKENRSQISSQSALKKIVNIVVFYSDNSFESFVPSEI